MLRDQKNSMAVVHLIDAKSNAAGAVKSVILPVLGFRGITFINNYGTFVPNTATAAVLAKLQESDTTVDTAFTDVAAADQVGTLAGILVDASNDQRSEMVGYVGVKKYVRMVVTVPADATSLVFSTNAIVSLGDKPATAPTPLAAT